MNQNQNVAMQEQPLRQQQSALQNIAMNPMLFGSGAAHGAQQAWIDSKIRDIPYLLPEPTYGYKVTQSSLIEQTCEAVNAMAEVQRICFAALRARKGIREMKFNFGPWRKTGALDLEEAEQIEAEWEVESICEGVKKWFELCDWVAANEVDAIAPGWKE